jgi:hypothetical protein
MPARRATHRTVVHQGHLHTLACASVPSLGSSVVGYWSYSVVTDSSLSGRASRRRTHFGQPVCRGSCASCLVYPSVRECPLSVGVRGDVRFD